MDQAKPVVVVRDAILASAGCAPRSLATLRENAERAVGSPVAIEYVKAAVDELVTTGQLVQKTEDDIYVRLRERVVERRVFALGQATRDGTTLETLSDAHVTTYDVERLVDDE